MIGASGPARHRHRCRDRGTRGDDVGAAGGAADPARIDPARLVGGRHVVGVLLTLFGVGRGRVRDLVVAVVVARASSILIVHARHSSRLIRAGAPRKATGLDAAAASGRNWPRKPCSSVPTAVSRTYGSRSKTASRSRS